MTYANRPRLLGQAFFLGFLLLLAACSASAAPDIQHWQTGNGAQVYFVRAAELPIVDARVVFDAGSARDTQQKSGLARLTNQVMTQGAGGLSADQIARRLEQVGARSGNGSARDMAWFTLRSLVDPKFLDPAVATLAEILTKPSFPKKDFERERQRMLVGLAQQKQSPGDIAMKAFYKAVYGQHPYANYPEGTEEGLKDLTLADLPAFYRQYYVARNAVVAIVGDLDRAGAEALAERLVGKLPAGEHAPALPPVKPLDGPKTVRIAYPSTQTHVLMGEPGMLRGDPQYFDLYVGNHVLGGSGLVSELSHEIREKRGLAYSTYSYFAPMHRKGPFVMGMQTRTDQAEEGVQLMRKVLTDFVQKGVDPKLLDASKQNITGGFPLEIDSNQKIVGYLAMIGFYGLPLDYLDSFNAHVEKTTAKSVDAAFRTRIQPDRLVTVIVGAQR